jgi:hypothetical protein
VTDSEVLIPDSHSTREYRYSLDNQTNGQADIEHRSRPLKRDFAPDSVIRTWTDYKINVA